MTPKLEDQGGTPFDQLLLDQRNRAGGVDDLGYREADASWRCYLPEEPASLADLVAENQRLEAAVAQLNDAAFGIMGITSRILVEAGLVSRAELADAVERRAGSPESNDQYPASDVLESVADEPSGRPIRHY